MKFMLDGCDIAFVAEAPGDRIIPDYCACGIRPMRKSDGDMKTEIVITYDDVQKVDKTSPCTIAEKGKVFEE